jgi:DNA-binding NarL/FixJ family response regulator
VIEAYRTYLPRLVLMDIAMEGIDGLKASRILKREFPSARIVIVSQYTDQVLREEAEAVGVIGYVTKDNLDPLKEFLHRRG